jgi:hypothetical protein
VVNSSGTGSYSVTVTSSRSYKGVALSDPTITVETSSRKLIGPFHPAAFGRQVSISYTGSAPATDLTVGAFKGV